MPKVKLAIAVNSIARHLPVNRDSKAAHRAVAALDAGDMMELYRIAKRCKSIRVGTQPASYFGGEALTIGWRGAALGRIKMSGTTYQPMRDLERLAYNRSGWADQFLAQAQADYDATGVIL